MKLPVLLASVGALALGTAGPLGPVGGGTVAGVTLADESDLAGLAQEPPRTPVSTRQTASAVAPDTPRPKHEPPPEVTALRSSVDRLIGGYGWAGAQWGVLAVSMDSGDTLVAVNPREPMAPASNVKLLTTAAALHYLGPDYRFATFVIADGPVSEGVVDGDLVLYGTGDPALSDRFYSSKTEVFERLADELQRRGLRGIRGRVVGDGTLYPGPERPPSWSRYDPGDWFVAPSSALSYNENVVTLRVEAGPFPGTPPVVHALPPTGGVAIDNRAVTVGVRSSEGLAILREDPAGPIVVRGEFRTAQRDAWRVVTVDDPPLYAADQLDRALRARGIHPGGPPGSVRRPEASRVSSGELWAPGLAGGDAPRVLAVHRSPPLVELLDVVNRESHNFFAEQILRAVGKSVFGDATFEEGTRAVVRYLRDVVGADVTGTALLDGSGLSAENRVSPGTFVRTLEHVLATPYWEDFWSTLPEAGNRRGLRRMWRTAAAGNLRAKTGTIRRVSALSGFVRAASGERIAFSIISNEGRSSSGAKRLEDQIGVRLATFDRPDPRPTVAFADPPVPSAGEPGRHTVEGGENLSVIAYRYGISLERLLAANPRVSANRIVPGQVLRIPAAR